MALQWCFNQASHKTLFLEQWQPTWKFMFPLVLRRHYTNNREDKGKSCVLFQRKQKLSPTARLFLGNFPLQIHRRGAEKLLVALGGSLLPAELEVQGMGGSGMIQRP